jgi:hypothetical protein
VDNRNLHFSEIEDAVRWDKGQGTRDKGQRAMSLENWSRSIGQFWGSEEIEKLDQLDPAISMMIFFSNKIQSYQCFTLLHDFRDFLTIVTSSNNSAE